MVRASSAPGSDHTRWAPLVLSGTRLCRERSSWFDGSG